ncbi:MAG: FKBP-type peptidyl-prolyl cis-trans isomerase [Nocardioides sp.]
MLRSSRASRRPAALLIPLLLVSTTTAACGEETTAVSGALSRTDALEVSGEVGSSPEISWKGKMEASDPETEILIEGEGAALEDGDQVLVNYYVGNGYTQQATLDTYADEQVPALFPVGGEVPQPLTAEPTNEQIARYLLDVFIAGEVEAGDTVGTRKIVTGSSADILGTAGSALDVGNLDALALVIDIDSVVRSKPDGKPALGRPSWVPRIGFADGLPSGLSFDGTSAPDGTLKKQILYPGTGPELAEQDFIVVDYLGQVFDAAKPFDSSYGRQTLSTTLGQGAVIDGWDQALVGVPVGSRVMLQIPPDLGYGKQGQGEDIPGGSTLYFVIDVLAAG